MQHTLHLLVTWLHVLAATIWIDGMAVLGLLLVLLLRRERFQGVARPLLYASALRFRWIGWGALGVLVLTGLYQVRAQGIPWSAWIGSAFWGTAWSTAFGWNLLLVIATLAVSAAHDFHSGPKALRLVKKAPDTAAVCNLASRALDKALPGVLISGVHRVAGSN